MKLLTFNCHEAWIHQLGSLGCNLDIVIGLGGRYTADWDRKMRPLPPRARLFELSEAVKRGGRYDCIIAHNVTDLLDAKSIAGPRLIVLHTTLEGRAANEQAQTPPEQIRAQLAQYLVMAGGHAVAISSLKGGSWGVTGDIVSNAVDACDYLQYDGCEAAGLRVANEISKRKHILLWEFHQRAFGGVPVRLIGHNPDMPGVTPARDWDDLKRILSRHRFFVHTADPRFEDGYNMATLEAMAAGLPVLGNRHPTSPVEHGVSGYLSDDPEELRGYAERLLRDRDLAAAMGAEARRIVMDKFSMLRFAQRFRRSINTAKKKWRKRKFDVAV
jgi:hypothetical protein